MKRSKTYSLALSILVAFSLWLYVVNNVSQEDDVTFFNIPVVMEGESVLAEKNLMITDRSAQTVSLNLSGTRSDLNKLNSGNIVIRANVSRIEDPGENVVVNYSIGFPEGTSASDYTVESKNPTALYVDVDYRRTKEVPVVVKWTGTRSEDYIYDTENAMLDYPSITVVGPAAVADLIDHAQIELDLTERMASVSDSFRYTLCDAEGNAVDAQQITTNVEEVHLELPIQRIREVRLAADVIYGGGANSANTTITFEPSSLRLSGGDALLAEFGDTYTVCTLNLAEMEKSDELIYTLSLPDGITNQTGVNEVKVKVRFTGMQTREFTLDTFQSVNVPAGMEAEIINASLTVRVRGPKEEVSRLTAEDITAVVDFSAAEPGTATYKASIVFAEGFPNVGALKTSTVSATLQAQEE